MNLDPIVPDYRMRQIDNPVILYKKHSYISVKATLMRSTSSGWVEVDSYSSSDSGSVLASRSFRLVTRGTYRVKAVFSCSGETLTTYSSARTY